MTTATQPITSQGMRLIVERQELVRELRHLLRLIPDRVPTPILQCVLFVARNGQLSLTVTDLGTSMKVSIGAVDVQRDGRSLVPAAPLHDVLNRMTDPTVELRTEDGMTLRVSGHQCQYEINTYDAGEFDSIVPDREWSESFTMPAGELMRGLRLTVDTASDENSHYVIRGVHFSPACVVSTDGRALAIFDLATPPPTSFTLDRRSCEMIGRTLARSKPNETVTMRVSAKTLRLLAQLPEDRLIEGELLEGAFPPYESVIPKDCPTSLVIDAAEFRYALRLALAIRRDHDPRGVMLTLAGDALTLESRTPEVGRFSIKVPCNGNGRDGAIGLDAKFALRAIGHLHGEVEMRWDKRNAPAMFVQGRYRHILMPANMEHYQ